MKIENLIMPKGKILVCIDPPQETKNGFYVPESNHQENIEGLICGVEDGSPLIPDTDVNYKCLIGNDSGKVIDVSGINPELQNRQENGYVFVVVEEKEILIIYK